MHQDRVGAMTVTAYELVDRADVAETTAAPGGLATVNAAPVPVELDTARRRS